MPVDDRFIPKGLDLKQFVKTKRAFERHVETKIRDLEAYSGLRISAITITRQASRVSVTAQVDM